MQEFRKGEKGISAAVGFVLIVAVVMMGLAVYLKEQMPQEWKQVEHEAMQEIKDRFLELREAIDELGRGDAITVGIPMGTLAPTAYVSASTNAELHVVTAMSVSDIDEAEDNANDFSDWRGYGTYVKEENENWNYTAGDYENDYLIVSTTEGQRIWTFLKFDLADSGLYNDDDGEFYDDVEIHSAQLLLYVASNDLEEEPDEPLEASPPQTVEVWGIENDAWGEGLTWREAQLVHDPAGDWRFENQDIDGAGEWVSWDVTRFVKDHFERYKGWGRWYQTDWDEEADLEEGKFSSGYDKYDSATAGISIIDGGENITGGGATVEWLTSMVFDAGDTSAFWTAAIWFYSGTAPTVELRFDNDPGMASPTPWMQGIDVHARFAQYRVDPNGGTFMNITLLYTCQISFVLREPSWGGENDTTSLDTRTAFNSTDNSIAAANDFDPKLRIVYSRSKRMGYTRTSSPPYGYHSIVNFGYIRHRSYNEEFLDYDEAAPDLNHVYEGGLVFLERGDGWYKTVLAYPSRFITVTPADGNNVYVTVTRYQIKESNLGGESVGGSGETTIRVARVQEDWRVRPPASPNASEVTITVVTDHPSVWRDCLERLAAEANHVLSDYEPGSFYTYGDYVDYDYDSISLTIKGKDLTPGVRDIYYSESVIWLDVTVGYFQGGRT
jgi:hypothetical protein